MSPDPDALNMHALVVRERILGPAHERTKQRTMDRAQKYADLAVKRVKEESGKEARHRAVVLWVHALHLRLLQKPIEAFLRFEEAERYSVIQRDCVSSSRQTTGMFWGYLLASRWRQFVLNLGESGCRHRLHNFHPLQKIHGLFFASALPILYGLYTSFSFSTQNLHTKSERGVTTPPATSRPPLPKFWGVVAPPSCPSSFDAHEHHY